MAEAPVASPARRVTKVRAKNGRNEQESINLGGLNHPMRNREIEARTFQDGQLRVAVIRRRDDRDPQPGAVERKLQADVAAWLRGRRSSR